MREKKKIILVKENSSLLNVLTNELVDLSNRTIRNYIKHGMVKVNNKVVKFSNAMLNTNDEVIINFSKREIPNYKLKIIYEDDDIIVIDKPAGLLTISNAKEKDITAFRMVSDYIKQNNPKSKLFVVHRLDQNTSGVLLFSKNLKLKEELQDRWNELVKIREYTCAVEGKITKNGFFESYLTSDHNQIIHSTKNKEIGKYAKTNYEVVKYNSKYSLLRVQIDTGRRNQIRVHMSEHGHPIVGDKKYGSKDNSINRLALHANRLVLTDIRDGKDLVFTSEVPTCITNICNKK